MKISYKPLWKTLIDKDMSKKDLRLNCDVADVITFVPDNDV